MSLNKLFAQIMITVVPRPALHHMLLHLELRRTKPDDRAFLDRLTTVVIHPASVRLDCDK